MSQSPPQLVDCATCDELAVRVAWGNSELATYRCTECHAGGHIDSDGGRHGGVFEELNNYATRQVMAA